MPSNPRLDVGQMRHRVTWQTLPAFDEGNLDEMSQEFQVWQTVGEYWANVEPVGGAEATNAGQSKTITTFKITMRNVGAIKSTDRFLFQGDVTRILDINSIFRVGERNAYLAITCTEQKNPQ